MSETLEVIRHHAKAGRIRVSQHAMLELSDYNIDLNDVVAGLANAIVVEDYPDYVKGPCVLCLQFDDQTLPVHVLWGLANQDTGVGTVITAYRPDPDRWMADFKTRKPR